MGERVAVVRRALGSRRLRDVELAFLGFGVAEYGVWVAVLVYAFQHGGTSQSGVIAVVQLLPAAALAPVVARLADRRSAFALRAGYLAQALTVGMTASAMLLHAPPLLTYLGAILAASAVTVTRPAQGALLPSLVQSPAELTAANVVSGWVESISLLVGPALAGLMIAAGGSGGALLLFATILLGGAALVAGVPDSVATLDGGRGEGSVSAADATTVTGLLRSRKGVPGLMAMMAVQFVALGAIDVLVVVLALRTLGLGASGAGYLDASFGAGAVLGGVAALAVVGRRRLVGTLLGAATVWGVAMLGLGAWMTVAGAFAFLAVAGASHTVLDVSGRAALHRAVPWRFHGRMFGVLEGLSMLGLAVGSISVPALVALGGTRLALGGEGVLLVVSVLAATRTLAALERTMPAPEAELTLLGAAPLFSALSPPVMEGLARALVPRQAVAGEVIIREDAPGSLYFLVASGGLTVTIDGEYVRTLGEGDGFGEIALLRDGIRTATVTATRDCRLYELDRGPFLDAVTGSYHVHRAAEELIARRLERV
jgi:cyclic nucleotide-binding protein